MPRRPWRRTPTTTAAPRSCSASCFRSEGRGRERGRGRLLPVGWNIMAAALPLLTCTTPSQPPHPQPYTPSLSYTHLQHSPPPSAAPQLLRELGLLPPDDVAELGALVAAVEQVGGRWRPHTFALAPLFPLCSCFGCVALLPCALTVSNPAASAGGPARWVPSPAPSHLCTQAQRWPWPNPNLDPRDAPQRTAAPPPAHCRHGRLAPMCSTSRLWSRRRKRLRTSQVG
jgi:hypothetical protein